MDGWGDENEAQPSQLSTAVRLCALLSADSAVAEDWFDVLLL